MPGLDEGLQVNDLGTLFSQEKATAMKVVHVVPSVSAEASGPSYSVVRLCESLSALG